MVKLLPTAGTPFSLGRFKKVNMGLKCVSHRLLLCQLVLRTSPPCHGVVDEVFTADPWQSVPLGLKLSVSVLLVIGTHEPNRIALRRQAAAHYSCAIRDALCAFACTGFLVLRPSPPVVRHPSRPSLPKLKLKFEPTLLTHAILLWMISGFRRVRQLHLLRRFALTDSRLGCSSVRPLSAIRLSEISKQVVGLWFLLLDELTSGSCWALGYKSLRPPAGH